MYICLLFYIRLYYGSLLTNLRCIYELHSWKKRFVLYCLIGYKIHQWNTNPPDGYKAKIRLKSLIHCYRFWPCPNIRITNVTVFPRLTYESNLVISPHYIINPKFAILANQNYTQICWFVDRHIKIYVHVCWCGKQNIQWWLANPGSDSSEISLIRTKSAGTDFRFWTDGRFSNPENSLIWKYQPGTNLSGLTNHHCTFQILRQRQTYWNLICSFLLAFFLTAVEAEDTFCLLGYW